MGEMETGGVPFELRGRERAFDGRFVKIWREHVRLPNGQAATFETIELPDAVAVVALEEEGERREVVLVEQFRPALRGAIHEVPAGIVDPGESPLEAARRELEEETGFEAERLELLAVRFHLPGTSAHRMHFFLARGLRPGKQCLDPLECLQVRRFPFRELCAAMLAPGGKSPVVVDTKTHLALLHAALVLGEVP